DTHMWETIDGWNVGGSNLGTEPDPVRVTSAAITGTLLSTLGVQPIKGRLITPDDDKVGAPRVAVISYGLWQRAFASDPKIVGRETTLQGNRCSIVGVMPKDFQFPPGEVDPPELWVPAQLNPAAQNRGSHGFFILGRLKPGVTIEQAR